MTETKLLDHGYVSLVETWGSDERIIESARMSTEGGFVSWEPYEKHPKGDQGLLEFLYKNKHMTPFEMCGATFEIQAPIFVFREWHRHRTQSYNEMSGRYTELPDLYYIPSLDRLKAGKQATKNKQSSEAGFSDQEAWELQEIIKASSEMARGQYETLLKSGVAREIARLVLPVNQYSRMRASANLRNWMGFLSLRMDASAQWEIRQYADSVCGILAEVFPRSMKLFLEGD